MKEFRNIWVEHRSRSFLRSFARGIHRKRVVRYRGPLLPRDRPSDERKPRERKRGVAPRGPPTCHGCARVRQRVDRAEKLPRELRTILHKSRDTPSQQNLGEILEQVESTGAARSEGMKVPEVPKALDILRPFFLFLPFYCARRKIRMKMLRRNSIFPFRGGGAQSK